MYHKIFTFVLLFLSSTYPPRTNCGLDRIKEFKKDYKNKIKNDTQFSKEDYLKAAYNSTDVEGKNDLFQRTIDDDCLKYCNQHFAYGINNDFKSYYTYKKEKTKNVWNGFDEITTVPLSKHEIIQSKYFGGDSKIPKIKSEMDKSNENKNIVKENMQVKNNEKERNSFNNCSGNICIKIEDNLLNINSNAIENDSFNSEMNLSDIQPIYEPTNKITESIKDDEIENKTTNLNEIFDLSDNFLDSNKNTRKKKDKNIFTNKNLQVNQPIVVIQKMKTTESTENKEVKKIEETFANDMLSSILNKNPALLNTKNVNVNSVIDDDIFLQPEFFESKKYRRNKRKKAKKANSTNKINDDDKTPQPPSGEKFILNMEHCAEIEDDASNKLRKKHVITGKQNIDFDKKNEDFENVQKERIEDIEIGLKPTTENESNEIQKEEMENNIHLINEVGKEIKLEIKSENTVGGTTKKKIHKLATLKKNSKAGKVLFDTRSCETAIIYNDFIDQRKACFSVMHTLTLEVPDFFLYGIPQISLTCYCVSFAQVYNSVFSINQKPENKKLSFYSLEKNLLMIKDSYSVIDNNKTLYRVFIKLSMKFQKAGLIY